MKLENSGPRNLRLGSSAKGFSLFELVVFIISVAIIYAFAANRFADFPAQAERANFIAVTTQLQSSLNIELMTVLASGQRGMEEAFEGLNPMDLLLRPPANYLGEFYNVDSSSLDRRSWYFEESRDELVYLVNDVGGVFYEVDGIRAPTEEIRFKVRLGESITDSRTGLNLALAEQFGEVPEDARQRRFSGVVLEPVLPFSWGEIGEDGQLLDAAMAQTAN